MWKWIGNLFGGALLILGLVDIPDQIRTWRDSLSIMSGDTARWLLVSIGMILVLWSNNVHGRLLDRLKLRLGFMSLQEAATLLYEAARKSDHLWSYAADRLGARGDSPSDEVLNWIAQLIANNNVKIYGKHPPSRIREEIPATNGFYRNGATEFWVTRVPRATAPAYVALEVRRSDLRPLIQQASAGSLEHG